MIDVSPVSAPHPTHAHPTHTHATHTHATYAHATHTHPTHTRPTHTRPTHTRPTHTHLTGAFLAAAILTVFSMAHAQVDDRARALLEGITPQADAEIHTLHQSMVLTNYLPDGTTQVMQSETVIDYDTRRAATIMDIGDGMLATTRYVDGKLAMTMTGVPMALPVPPDAAKAFENIFESPSQPILHEGASATYDGHQAYGDLVEGEQVTYVGNWSLQGLPEGSSARFIFDGAGLLLATVTVSPGSPTVLMVYDEPLDGEHLAGASGNLYTEEDGEWVLTSTITFETWRINEPIDETVFE
ncbi:MAG: hypothetical protein R6W77_13870 [Trueperaceae bacterium]